jgi:hypothetical protein
MHRVRRFGLGAAVVFVVAACGGSANPAPGTPGPAPSTAANPIATLGDTTPSTTAPSAPSTPGGGDISVMFGVWSSESSKIEFHADGTYIRLTRVDLGITFSYSTIAIDEEGTYQLGDGNVTFTPTSGHYRRDGVDEGYELKVVVQTISLEPNADQTAWDLVLDGVVWTKDAAG